LERRKTPPIPVTRAIVASLEIWLLDRPSLRHSGVAA
jgi:hypothetical protein